jgi:hypothetical protein
MRSLTPVVRAPVQSSNKWRGKDYKKGCTGKVWYRNIEQAIKSINRILDEEKDYGLLQAYRCIHCNGYHLTGSRIRIWNCPITKSFHVFKPIKREIYCKFCGVRSLKYKEVSLLEKWWLRKLPKEPFYKYKYAVEISQLNKPCIIAHQYRELFHHLLDLGKANEMS